MMIVLLWTITAVHAITDTRSSLGLTEFPTDVNADVTKLMLTNNAISHVAPEALYGLPVLRYLSIAENSLTVFPNLTAVADSLEQLYAYGNAIVYVDGELVAELHKLQGLSLQDNHLSSFPTLSWGACNSLTYVTLAENPLVIAPSFRHYTALTKLSLHTTHMTEFPALGDQAANISILYLQKTAITEIPAKIVSLRELKLTSSTVSSLRSPCHTDISSLTIRASAAPMPVCECAHVWLKVAADLGASIEVDDADCSGQQWSVSSVEQLLHSCWNSTSRMIATKARRVFRGYFCHFPVHSLLTDVTVRKCLSVCLITPGCVSFNFLDHGHTGDCVILAPGGNLDLTVSDATSPDWSYYVT